MQEKKPIEKKPGDMPETGKEGGQEDVGKKGGDWGDKGGDWGDKGGDKKVGDDIEEKQP